MQHHDKGDTPENPQGYSIEFDTALGQERVREKEADGTGSPYSDASDDSSLEKNEGADKSLSELELFTVNHDKIKKWINERGGRPISHASLDYRLGVLLDDSGLPADYIFVSWNEFFRIFDANDLTFVYKTHQANGALSTFNTFLVREDVERITEAREQP